MNIALFTDSYIPTKSGVVTVVLQLREILKKMGHHVVVVTAQAQNYEYQEEDEEDVFRIKSFHAPLGDEQYLGIPIHPHISEFLKKHEIQLIHAHTEFTIGQAAVFYGKYLHIPVIATTHTMWEDYYRYYLKTGKLIPKRVVRRIVREAYKHFYAYINVSEKARNYFKQKFMCPKIPSTVIPNAIDQNKWIGKSFSQEEKLALRKQLGIGENDKVVLNVGRCVEEKRVIELNAVMERIVTSQENCKMLFVGSGGALETLRKDVEQKGLSDKIIFTGFVNWKELYKYYSIADVFVTASLSEMHSMTVLEALTFSLPIVARRDTSFTDTIFHGVNGFFADTDEEMDQYILELIGDSEKCTSMGKKGFEISSNFSLEMHGKRTVAFYEAVLKAYPQKITDEELLAAVSSIEK